MKFKIRFCTVDDAAQIKRIAYATWPRVYATLLEPAQLTYMLEKMYAIDELTRQLKDPDYFFLLAENESGEVIGFAGVSRTAGDIFHLQKLYVLPDFHKKGCGHLLLQKAIHEILQRGGNCLELNVKRDNPARFFYEKLGFTIKESVDIDIGSGYFMRDYIMQKKLTKD